MQPPSHARPPPVWAVPLAVTLLVVFGIGACLTLAVGGLVLLVPRHRPARIDITRTDAQSVRSAAVMYVSENPGGACPKVEALIRGEYLDSNRRVTDAWDRPFVVECRGDDVEVVSRGPDGKLGTADDVR